ncbi:hypothetical protein AAG570_006647, partial [Ranatra chinensis]
QDVVILSKRPELNHYRNQTYDKLSPIPLITKGWHHYKSKGDYFQIRICNEEQFIENLFWNDEKSSFSDLSLSENLVQALKKIDIIRPTKVQLDSIPTLLSGSNCLMTAETGCGKTLAYLIPAVEQCLRWLEMPNLCGRPPNTPLVLILTPSRELARQIGDVAISLSHHLPFSCYTLVGGRTKKKMLDPDYRSVDLMVASIGAVSKLTTMGIYDMSKVRHLILDEADTLLDDSFSELLVRYLKKFKIRYKPHPKEELSNSTQLTLVGATLPRSIYKTLQEFVETDSLVPITSGRLHKVIPHILQTFYRLGTTQKPPKLLYLVKEAVSRRQPVLIFSNKSKTSDWISLMLNENNIETVQLNGDMPHIVREGKFLQFQNGRLDVLSCTDIASRGLDTIRAKCVINYDFPMYIADYIHRCGRTGRIGGDHNSQIHNFVSGSREVNLVQKIEVSH